MKVAVHYYAAARELAGCDAEAFEFPTEVTDQAELRLAVAQRRPSLESYLAGMRLALNGDFVDRDEPVRDGDRIDILPPVAGGSPVALCDIVDHEISIDDCRRAVEHPSAGGLCMFTGIVRDHAEGKTVARLDYEAHESLAKKEMARVLDRVATSHPGTRLAAVHRVGQLAVGDVAVCVAASAAHRDEAFVACRAAIDQIKETVPVWKKEWGPGGEAHWVNLEE
ncbi:MAG: molybdenum cofactor biosynthesis protein MoaE [Myxococcota bacterium]